MDILLSVDESYFYNYLWLWGIMDNIIYNTSVNKSLYKTWLLYISFCKDCERFRIMSINMVWNALAFQSTLGIFFPMFLGTLLI